MAGIRSPSSHNIAFAEPWEVPSAVRQRHSYDIKVRSCSNPKSCNYAVAHGHEQSFVVSAGVGGLLDLVA